MHYYNEFDPFAANWLRNLMQRGLITDGIVDERSITDVDAKDLVGHEQCHFFGGIGGWPLAFRLAGIPESLNVWSMSCPCQPFSHAGKQKAQKDARHLWPVCVPLIRSGQPEWIFGEQVASAVRFGWLDEVKNDLEEMGYIFGCAILTASSIGAPHIRARIFWGAKLLTNVSACCNIETDRRTYGDSYATMHEMQSDVSSRRFWMGKQGQEQAQIRLQGMQPQTTGQISCRTQGREEPESARIQIKKPASRQEVRSRISSEIPVANDASACEEEGGKVRMGIRPGSAFRGIQESSSQDEMRDDWNRFGVRRRCRKSRKAILQHPINRSHRRASWIYLQKHPDCLLGNECSDGNMGRGCLKVRDDSVAEGSVNETDVDVRRRTESARRDTSAREARNILAGGSVWTWGSGIRPQMECDYIASGSIDSDNHSVGAPHIRQRIYWGAKRVSDTGGYRIRAEESGGDGSTSRGVQNQDWERQRIRLDVGNGSSRLSHTDEFQFLGKPSTGKQSVLECDQGNVRCGLLHTSQPGSQGYAGNGDGGDESGRIVAASAWSDFTVGRFRDGKYRRIGRGVRESNSSPTWA